jgi:hypothetical protein
MNHLKFQDPMILKFERSAKEKVLESVKRINAHIYATPQQQCAAQKQDGATDAPVKLEFVVKPDAAAPLKPGDLVMWLGIISNEWRPMHFVELLGNKGHARVLDRKRGHEFDCEPGEWRLPTPAELAETWIEWAGGECPVAAGTRVEIKTTDPEMTQQGCKAGVYRWRHNGKNDIIAYRVLP